MNTMNRRSFLAASGVTVAAAAVRRARAVPLAPAPQPADRSAGDKHRGPCVVSSANGQRAVDKAMAMIADGADPVDTVVQGVAIVESDPDDMSVGYGGLPNEQGVVQLDSSVMHGPTHKAGAVAALENIKNPAQVALKVLKRTDHVLLVGAGALAFAKAQGFKEENLLTDKARRAWLRWKQNLSPRDDWLDDEQMDFKDSRGASLGPDGVPYTWGTINCSALNDDGDLASVTTTSGLSYKIPGRVGDSPIVGAGMYVDNAVGAAGATGRGEAVIQNCGSFSVVDRMAGGLGPTEACLAVLKRIAERTKQKRLLDSRGRPNFQVTFYALRKDGAYGCASMRPGARFAVHDGAASRIEHAPSLLEGG